MTVLDTSTVTEAQADSPSETATEAALALQIARALALREQHWYSHPLVRTDAKLPTNANLDVLGIVERAGRKQRKPVSFWAHPVTGKSFTILLIEAFLREAYPGCGIFIYEAKGKTERPRSIRADEVREREFFIDLLAAMSYEGRIESAVPRAREQIQKALLAMSLPARHLFFIFDEAQEISADEYKWMKTILNWLARNGVQLGIFSFGQYELLEKRDEIAAKFRSDIHARFIGNVYELKGLQDAGEFAVPLKACDDQSEYPAGSGLTYTAFLFPLAHANGFRFESLATRLWDAFMKAAPLRRGESGIAMQYFADVLSELVEILRDRDSPDMAVTDEDLMQAISYTDYVRREPVRERAETRQ
ncbi:ATP-binding protein [Lysobacter xanthus]